MKFNVPSKTLYTTASSVSKVINSKNALTILNNFHFRLTNESLTITGSDVENALSAIIPVTEVEGEGEFCLDARRMVELLKEIPSQGLTFEISDETLETTITYSAGHYSMIALPGDQYPAYKKEETQEEPVCFTCRAESVVKGLSKASIAVGSDDFHPQMMGVYFDIKPDSITFVGTDTRQLVRYIDSSVAPGVTASCIIPQKPVKVMQEVFAGAEDISITMTSKSATITGNGFTFNCRFIKGNFPPYERVIPKNNPYTMRVDRMRFLNAVRRVSIFVDPGFGMIKFKFANDRITLKSVDPNLCTLGLEEVDCEYNGPELVIGFSAPYLANICSNISTQDIIVTLSDPSRAGVFCPSENAENTDLLMLLMPMNVSEF